MSYLDDITITEPRCLARNEGVYCSQKPALTCPKCLLMTYCSEECRKAHWPAHKPECVVGVFADDPSEGKKENWRDPGHYAKYAAVDVLNLEKNEGKDFKGSLDLLFLGESSLRNLIYTFIKIPDTTPAQINATVNETSPHHLARLIITVLILTDTRHDPIINAEAVVHLWYSAKIPHALYHHLETVAGDLMDTIIADMRHMHDNNRLVEGDSFPITMGRKNCTVVISINYSQWSHIIKFARPSGWTHGDATFFRGIDCKKHAPPLHQLLQRMTGARAAGMMRWRSDGLLLPYGHPREDFNTLNPLFFANHEPYPVGASQEPLMEWPIELLDYSAGPAQNDVYGKMFYYVRDLCVSFQERLRDPTMQICITSKLLEHLHFNKKKFDRIEAGDYWDWYPLLTFVESTDLLRHQDENPNATLLILSRETVCHHIESVQKELDAEEEFLRRPTNTVLDEYAPPVSEEEQASSQATTRRRLGLVMWRNWDKFSDRYLSAPHYLNDLNEDQTSRGGIMDAAFSGLSLKVKNTITRRWPNRMVHSRTAKPSLRDFNRWLGWGLDNKPERWLEWKKVGDIDKRAWRRYHRLGLEEKACIGGSLEPMSLKESIQKCTEDLQKPEEVTESETEDAEQENGKTEAVASLAEGEDKEETASSDTTMGRDEEQLGDKPKAKKKRSKKKKQQQQQQQQQQ